MQDMHGHYQTEKRQHMVIFTVAVTWMNLHNVDLLHQQDVTNPTRNRTLFLSDFLFIINILLQCSPRSICPCKSECVEKLCVCVCVGGGGVEGGVLSTSQVTSAGRFGAAVPLDIQTDNFLYCRI